MPGSGSVYDRPVPLPVFDLPKQGTTNQLLETANEFLSDIQSISNDSAGSLHFIRDDVAIIKGATITLVSNMVTVLSDLEAIITALVTSNAYLATIAFNTTP